MSLSTIFILPAPMLLWKEEGALRTFIGRVSRIHIQSSERTLPLSLFVIVVHTKRVQL